MTLKSIKTLLLLASTCLPTCVLAAALPRRSTSSWQPEPIQWKDCGEGVPNTVDCATLAVPLNWADPHRERVTLALKRLRATDNATAENLLLNLGGPGGSAASVVSDIASGEWRAFDKLRKHYNLIGPDPRGIGQSTPIKCDVDLFNERVSRYPQTEADFNKLVQHNKAFGESCLKLSGDIVKHVDTASVARDFEAVRQALGDGKLNLLAISYGTQIAAQYAELFPQSVGRFVLDGVVDHSGSEMYSLVTESATRESAFNRFEKWCANSNKCALQGKDVAAILEKLIKQADKTPIPVPGCNGTSCREDDNGEELRLNVANGLGMYNSNSRVVDLELEKALEGDASMISTPLADAENYAEFARRAVLCLDWFHSSKSVSDLLYKQQLLASTAPHTHGAGGTWEAQTNCIGWPVPIQNPPHQVDVQGAPPMLLVNSLYDPATSYTWAVGVKEQIPGAVLLTRKGEGHGSYTRSGEAHHVIDAFLVGGKMPAENTVVYS